MSRLRQIVKKLGTAIGSLLGVGISPSKTPTSCLLGTVTHFFPRRQRCLPLGAFSPQRIVLQRLLYSLFDLLPADTVIGT